MLAQTLAQGGKMPKVKIRSTAHVLALPAPPEGRAVYFDTRRARHAASAFA